MERYWGCDKDLPCRPGESPYRIKGEFYRNVCETMSFVEKKSGGRLRGVLETLGIRAFLDQDFLATKSYDLLPLPRATMAMAHVLGRELREFTKRMGTNGAKLQMTGIYKSIFETMSTDNFAQRFGRVVGHLYDHGPVTIQRSGNQATLDRRDIPACAVEWWNLVSVPFVTLPLEQNGAHNLQVSCEIVRAGSANQMPLAHTSWRLSWDQA
jgi:hypothetical protein